MDESAPVVHHYVRVLLTSFSPLIFKTRNRNDAACCWQGIVRTLVHHSDSKHLQKGVRLSVRRGLRRWQQEARQAFWESSAENFQVTATPGAGKTRFAITIASDALERGIVDQIIVVAPTDHLRTQWAEAALGRHLKLDPTLSNRVSKVRNGFHGYVTTYAQIAAAPKRHQLRAENTRTLVILDEIHHAGDGLRWGDAIAHSFESCVRRLTLSGTPFRTRPGETIPFVRYEQTGDTFESQADYTYGYSEALADGVVRPVVFAAYTGQARWLNSAGEVVAAGLGEGVDGKANTKSVEQYAWRTALDPRGDWVPHVIAAMDDRLNHQRSHGIPDAGGLILASDQDSARAYAAIVKDVTGDEPVVVLSDDADASSKISRYRDGTNKYAVCVRMISEGCDIPRATTIAYMTSYRTSLFFAQAIGRVVRSRRPKEMATVFLPAVRPLLELAAQIEVERNHVFQVPPSASEDALDELVDVRLEEKLNDAWSPLGADAEFGHVLQGGRAVSVDHTALAPDDESQDFLGLPGLLTVEQTAALLAKRDGDIRRKAKAARNGLGARSETVDLAPWEELAQLRREVNAAVAAVAASTGEPHSAVHVWVRSRVPGPASNAADAPTLRKRRSALRSRLVKTGGSR